MGKNYMAHRTIGTSGRQLPEMQIAGRKQRGISAAVYDKYEVSMHRETPSYSD